MRRMPAVITALLAVLGLALAGSALAQKAETPKTDAKKKCAKDDFECLYGDGT